MSSPIAPPLLSPFHVDHDDAHSFVHLPEALLSPKVCAHLRGFVKPVATGTASSTLAAPAPSPATPRVVKYYRSGDRDGPDEDCCDTDASRRLSIVIHGIGGTIAGGSTSGNMSSTSSNCSMSHPTPTASAAIPVRSSSTSDGALGDSCITTTTLSIPSRTPSALTPCPPKSAWRSHHVDAEEHKKRVDFSREVVVIIPANDDGGEEREEDEGDEKMVDVDVDA